MALMNLRTALKASLAIGVLLTALIVALVFFNRFEPSDMSVLAPADAQAFLEMENIPHTISALATNKYWSELFPALRRTESRTARLLRRLASLTGCGPAQLILMDRAQVALAVLELDSRPGEGNLNIRPGVVLIIETHMSEKRARPVIDGWVSKLAGTQFPSLARSTSVSGGQTWTQWQDTHSGRSLFLTFRGSVAYLASDELSLRRCLQVDHSSVKDLSTNSDYQTALRRRKNPSDLAFGYLSSSGVGAVMTLIARGYSEKAISDPRAASALAGLIPGISERLSGNLSWEVNFKGGRMEDEYVFDFKQKTSSDDDEAFSIGPTGPPSLAAIPPATDVISWYRFSNPSAAWKRFRTAVTVRLDATSSLIVSRLMDVLLEPYGINDPQKFLAAVEPSIVSARVDDATIVVARVRDEKALLQSLKGKVTELGGRKNGQVQMIANNNPDHAIAGLNGLVLLGPYELLNQSISEAGKGDEQSRFGRILTPGSGDNSQTITISSESSTYEKLRTVVSTSRRGMVKSEGLSSAGENGLFSKTETVVSNNGFNRTVDSNFGLLGQLVLSIYGESN